MIRLAIAGGGTGGHLFPGLAVAELARDRGMLDDVVFFGAARGIEAWAVPKAGFEVITDNLHGVYGARALAAARAVAEMLAATRRIRRELRRRRTQVLIGLGGYASAPAVLAARTSSVPVVLLEQNREPGISNRVLGRLASLVCTSFESTTAAFPAGKAVCTGNPLRRGFEAAPPYDGRDLILVFGGSSGARSLNRAVVAALAERSRRAPLPPVVHQVGKPFVEEISAAYRQAEIEAEVVAFIDDMPSMYARARLAICRAGATSIAELVATATPAVLVPLATAAGGHQEVNARELEGAGAARVVADDDACARGLTQALDELLSEPGPLPSMSRAASSLGRPGAAERVLELVAGLAERG